jgi:hypothetical protein
VSFRISGLRLVKVRHGETLRTARGRSRREKADVNFRAHQAATGSVQIKGSRRTFVLFATRRAPEGGIYQRVGPGRDDIRLIYPFVRAPHLKAMLHWMQTATAAANRWFTPELNRNVRLELARAFGWGR